MAGRDASAPDGGVDNPVFKVSGDNNPALKIIEPDAKAEETYLPVSNFLDRNALTDYIRCYHDCERFGMSKTQLRLLVVGQGAIGGEQMHWFARGIIGVIEEAPDKAKSWAGRLRDKFIKRDDGSR